MGHFMRKTCLFAGLAGALLLVGCSDQDEAQQEADQLAEETGQAVDAAPAMPGEPEAVPAPDNVAEPPEDAEKSASGLAWIVLEDAAGTDSPTVQDTVTVHYTGWTTDGQMFDSSVARDEPATFPLNQLIAGWQEAIPLMTVGDKYRFWIPGELAYDNSTRPGAPKGTLVFDIELLGVKRANAEPPSGEGG